MNEKVFSQNQIRDEFFRILNSPKAKEGIEEMHENEVLKQILPELEEGIGQVNRPAHLTVWEHNLKALEYAVRKKYSEEVRLAALLHDIGKPKVAKKAGEIWTFHGHEVEGAKIAKKILERLKVSGKKAGKILTLVRWHLFRYESEEETTDSSVRRLIKQVGAENMSDLVKLRICDRMGMDVPKPVPYRLRHFQYRVEKILREREKFTPKMLKLNGDAVARILNISPGPKIGFILNILLEEIIDEPKKNAKKHLESRVIDLGKLSDHVLQNLAKEAAAKIRSREEKRISSMKEKYYVK